MELVLRSEVTVPLGLDQTLPHFADARFVEQLAPAVLGLRVHQIGMRRGERIVVSLFGRLRWVSDVVMRSERPKALLLTDRSSALPWPLDTWQHEHSWERVLRDGREVGTRVVDTVRYRTRPRLLAPLLWPALWLSFWYRARAYRRLLRREIPSRRA